MQHTISTTSFRSVKSSPTSNYRAYLTVSEIISPVMRRETRNGILYYISSAVDLITHSRLHSRAGLIRSAMFAMHCRRMRVTKRKDMYTAAVRSQK